MSRKKTNKSLLYNLCSILPCLGALFTCVQPVRAQTLLSVPDSLADAVNILMSPMCDVADSLSSIAVIQEYASHDMPYALHVLGSLHMEGKGVPQDTALAIAAYRRAGSLGFTPAWHNLGLVYKYGVHGIPQNYEEMFSCFSNAIDNMPVESGSAYYDMGYARFKGLGCAQNYDEAFLLFLKAATLGYAPAAYMTGICYRNGYGVTRDAANAEVWLETAALDGYDDAMKELMEPEPENTHLQPVQLEGISIDVPNQYVAVEPIPSMESLSGSYKGSLFTFDWSGKYLLRQDTLSLDIFEQDGQIETLWYYPVDTLQFTGRYEDGTIHFDAVYGSHANHYAPEGNLCFFQEADVNVVGDRLAASLRMYSLTEMEPERPMCLMLQKEQYAADAYNCITRVSASPSPFINELHFSFELLEQQDVHIGIYSTSGNVEYFMTPGVLDAGEHDFVAMPSVARGNHLLKIFAGPYTYQTIIVKK